MWIHIVIFMIILGFLLACRAGWIQAEPLGGRRSLRLFLAVAAGGNILGMAFTMTGGSPAVYDDGLRIEKGSGGIHEEEFQVAASGEEMETVRIQVPEKETEEEEAPAETEEAEEESRERRIREMVEEYNSQKRDPDYYYLPARWEGETFTWRRPGDPSGALLASMGLFAAFVVLMKKSREAQEREMKRSEQLLMDYPALVMKFALLIQAGMTAGRAFRKIAGDYRRRNPDGGRSAYDAVAAACYEMDSGVAEQEAYRRFGERCGQMKYKTFSTLLIQNLQKGSRHMADILEQEALDAWDERKRKARVLGEAAATKLLLPMVMMLAVVMAIIMIPAFLSFYG